MFITIINDCRCENAKIRQLTRAASLFDASVHFSGVQSDREAAYILGDVLDASEGRKGVVLVNVAPRNGSGKKYPNGTPFGYFFFKDTLVISSIAGLTLSVVKKLGITESVRVIDIPEVLSFIKEKEKLSESLCDQIINTQFRSFDYLPRVAQWILNGYEIPFEEYSLENVESALGTVCWIDNFGNCKTNILEKEKQDEISLNGISLPFYKRLKDVPDGEAAVVVGSSGVGDSRFLEIVVQGKSAAKIFNLQVGNKVL
ncbi:MAG: hypothetical protein COV59_05080 [Candidatus Magasanikbacteria bacterium CG11_big_fil_rev_8_21_14_0_20_39_34]|uniref:S-adenosyl-l-methionine hydroxide adenosyltransferase C-terminal domain-containing protein n=1 Tax=Candidatus Magasanikbacteria bacterium CG11_big_fil_rev_8_21_14_0_20_39_34 TaxID=1974653 RepID=A0A2H0N604_9BACT|nr:MAG: hypothetical protein COV59_05080 [Candidatus Magasanikbacteria bacterium CG11_big_fil_rev_8_21_14_0_20_39_34]